MNRVAAQNARDRRKNYLESLEMKVAQLEQQVSNGQMHQYVHCDMLLFLVLVEQGTSWSEQRT